MKEKKYLFVPSEVGEDEIFEQRDLLNKFVEENFLLLYEGGVRLGCNIEEDSYAPRRVQINNTRLHQYQGLKIAGGHHYRSDSNPTEANILNAVKDIQELLDAAAKRRECSFEIVIKTKK